MALFVRESPYGLGFAELLSRTGMTVREMEQAGAAGPFTVLHTPQPWLLDRAWFQATVTKLTAAVRDFHRTNPLLPGIAKQDLRARELPDSPPFLIDALLAAAREIVMEGETVRLGSHKLVLKQDEQEARAAIEGAFEHAGLSVPAVAEVLVRSGVEMARARSLLQMLLRERRLVRVNDDFVFHHTAINRLRALLAGHRGQRFTVTLFKDWTGISRKYAIPLLEYLDRERVTRREGDQRLVL